MRAFHVDITARNITPLLVSLRLQYCMCHVCAAQARPLPPHQRAQTARQPAKPAAYKVSASLSPTLLPTCPLPNCSNFCSIAASNSTLTPPPYAGEDAMIAASAPATSAEQPHVAVWVAALLLGAMVAGVALSCLRGGRCNGPAADGVTMMQAHHSKSVSSDSESRSYAGLPTATIHVRPHKQSQQMS